MREARTGTRRYCRADSNAFGGPRVCVDGLGRAALDRFAEGAAVPEAPKAKPR